MYAELMAELQRQVDHMKAWSEDLISVQCALDEAIEANEKLIELLPVLDHIGSRGVVTVEEIALCSSQTRSGALHRRAQQRRGPPQRCG